jgi:hypothetical protein
MSKAEAAVVNIPRSLVDRVTDALCYAASMDKVELSSTFALPSGRAFQQDPCVAHALARHLCRGGQGV